MNKTQSKFVYLVNSNDLYILEYLNRHFNKKLAPMFKPAIVTSPYLEKGKVLKMNKNNYSLTPVIDWKNYDYDERPESIKNPEPVKVPGL